MICPICEKEFEVTKGHGGQNRKICYNCLPNGLSKYERDKLKRQLFYKKINDYKIKRGCDRCGYNKYPSVLEWHHQNDEKNFNPADRLKDGSLQGYYDYLEEIKDCMLLCANCHREVHIEGV